MDYSLTMDVSERAQTKLGEVLAKEKDRGVALMPGEERLGLPPIDEPQEADSTGASDEDDEE